MVLPPTQTGKTDGRVVGEMQVFCFSGVQLKMSGGSPGMDVLSLSFIDVVQTGNIFMHK